MNNKNIENKRSANYIADRKMKKIRTKEQAIKNPSPGDRWLFPCGISEELTNVHQNYTTKQMTEWYCRTGFCGSSRFFASQGQDFASKVHAATYLGNFAV